MDAHPFFPGNASPAVEAVLGVDRVQGDDGGTELAGKGGRQGCLAGEGEAAEAIDAHSRFTFASTSDSGLNATPRGFSEKLNVKVSSG